MTVSTKRENVARVRDRLCDPASSNAWNSEAADMLDALLAERDAARAEAMRLRDLLKRADEELRLIRMKDTGAVYDIGLRVELLAALTGEPRHDR